MRDAGAIEAELEELYAARKAVALSQEYTTADGRRLRRADLSAINDTIRQLERDLVRARAGGGIMAKRVYTYGV